MDRDRQWYADWIEDLHETEREGEIRRAKWLHEAKPKFEGRQIFHGGFTSSNLYEEAQYAFLHGLFQTCMITSLSVIEQELIGILHAAGVDGIENQAAATAIDEAADRDLISPEEEDLLHQIRKVRNPTVHFRVGVDDDAFPRRAIEKGRSPIELAEEEAKTALLAMFNIIEHGGIGTTTNNDQNS